MTYFLADVICDFFTFQQDSVPAHRASATVSGDTRLQQPTGLAAEQFRSQSGGLIRFGAFCRNKSIAARSVMLTIWKNNWLKSDVVLTFHQNIIDRAVNQWRDRLHKCVRAKGEHFEHLIWTFWQFWLTPTALETHDLWVIIFKISYLSKVEADFYETTL